MDPRRLGIDGQGVMPGTRRAASASLMITLVGDRGLEMRPQKRNAQHRKK